MSNPKFFVLIPKNQVKVQKVSRVSGKRYYCFKLFRKYQEGKGGILPIQIKFKLIFNPNLCVCVGGGEGEGEGYFRDIHATSGIPNSPQSPDIGQNSGGGISDFPIFGQSLTKKIVVTPEPVTILT